MIVWNLSKVMAIKGVDYKALAELIDMHPVTVNRLMHRSPTQIHTQTLDRICCALQCQPGELIEYRE